MDLHIVSAEHDKRILKMHVLPKNAAHIMDGTRHERGGV